MVSLAVVAASNTYRLRVPPGSLYNSPASATSYLGLACLTSFDKTIETPDIVLLSHYNDTDSMKLLSKRSSQKIIEIFMRAFNPHLA
jgi:hypothetical protein